MPKTDTPRRQRNRPEPYHRFHQATISRLRAANKKIGELTHQLDRAQAVGQYWQKEYDLNHKVMEVMSRHVKRILNEYGDSGEVKLQELLVRLRMMNLNM